MIFLKKIKLIKIGILTAILAFPSVLQAQTFGFGCLGLSGFYAGYSQYSYKADGLNESLLQLNPNMDPDQNNIEFKEGTGYRIGANFFRARFNRIFFTAKGFYQFQKETKDVVVTDNSGLTKRSYELSMNHWGIGVDLGVPVFGIFDLKIVEGGVNFYNGEFSAISILDNNNPVEVKYQPDDLKIGYYVGSGLILHLIPDYISIEGTAFYTFFNIENMKNSASSVLPLSPDTKFIKQGGFSATLQLNVGFPL